MAPAELDGWRTSNAGRWLVLATDADVAAAHATRLFFPANRRLFGFVRDDRTEDLWQLTSRLRCFGEPVFRVGAVGDAVGPEA